MPASPASLVRVHGVHKYYTRGSERIDVLRGVNLEVPAGEFLALMGPSGSGKTTLLNLLGGLDAPSGGTIEVGGVDIGGLGGSALARWRARHIGFVFQLYNLLPVLTAERNVELPLLLAPLSKAERRKRVAIALKVVGLSDRARHYPRQLSGGQEQRVGIARAIVTDPTLLLCDEPTGDLDRKAGDEVLDLLRALNREHGKTIVMVTHDPARGRAGDAHDPSRQGRAHRGAGMKFLPLVWRTLWRRKIRTTFTLGCIFVAFLLFGLLMTIRAAFSIGVELAGLDRLVIIHKVSLIMPLPVCVPGAAGDGAGRGGGDAQYLVRRHLPGSGELLRPDRARAGAVLRASIPSIRLPADQMKAWLADRQGAVGGPRPGRPVRLEGRRSDSHPGHHLAAEVRRRRHLGVQPRRHLRRRQGRRQDAVLLPLRLPRREPVAGRRDWSAGTSSKIDDPSQSVEMAHRFDDDVRQLLVRDEDDDREGIRRELREADRRHRRRS